METYNSFNELATANVTPAVSQMSVFNALSGDDIRSAKEKLTAMTQDIANITSNVTGQEEQTVHTKGVAAFNAVNDLLKEIESLGRDMGLECDSY